MMDFINFIAMGRFRMSLLFFIKEMKFYRDRRHSCAFQITLISDGVHDIDTICGRYIGVPLLNHYSLAGA